MELPILQRGSCEPLKASIHAASLGLFAIMGLYNAAAWLTRRQTHLAVNAVLYSALTIWEHTHVEQHLIELRRCRQRESEADKATEAAKAAARPSAPDIPAEVAA